MTPRTSHGALWTLVAALTLTGSACSSNPRSSPDAGPPEQDAGTSPDSGTAPGSDAGTPDGGIIGTGYQDRGNHSFATAASITVDGMGIAATLSDATTTLDYYKFTANAGDTYAVFAFAQGEVAGDTAGNYPWVVDTVVTIYDSNHNQLAQDDDAWPSFGTDPQLFFEVPSDGDYYVSVGGCATAFASTGNCPDASQVTDLDYVTFIANVDLLNAPEVNAGTSQDGTTGNAVSVRYTKSTTNPGAYNLDVIDGNLVSTTDTHVFWFTPPTDTMTTSGVANEANFWIQPPGPNDGDGSTANVVAWVTDHTGTNVLGKLDTTNFGNGDNTMNGPAELDVPITLGQQYYLFVQNAATTSNQVTDYYYILHIEGPEGDSVESEPNNTPAQAQVLSPPTGLSGEYFVAGTLSSTGSGGDVDWYEVDVPSGTTKVNVGCAAERSGSGLRGTTFGLYTLNGETPEAIPGTSATEAANMNFEQLKVAVPSGTTKAYLQVSAASQDSTVTGNFYYCSVIYF
jgi:hypothetical protein